MSSNSALFETVPEDHMSVYDDYSKVVSLLEFDKKDVARAARVPVNSVRYDEKIPLDLRNHLNEWAVLLNMVARFFKGDAKKTVLWFTIPNPLLGNYQPRDMIRFGRYKKLRTFIWNAIQENMPQD